MEHIVVYDPAGEYWEGALVEEKHAKMLRAERGVATLPVQSEMFRKSGVGGFHKRSWGAGWPLDSQVHMTVAPLTLFITDECSRLYWAAHLFADEAMTALLKEGGKLSGQLRFIPDVAQLNRNRLGYTDESIPFEAANFKPPPEEGGGWIVEGCARVSVPVQDYYGFALYGAVPGLRVAWCAATVTR